MKCCILLAVNRVRLGVNTKHTNIKGCFSLKGPTVPITALPSESIIVGDSGSSMIFKGGKISEHIHIFARMFNKNTTIIIWCQNFGGLIGYKNENAL